MSIEQEEGVRARAEEKKEKKINKESARDSLFGNIKQRACRGILCISIYEMLSGECGKESS